MNKRIPSFPLSHWRHAFSHYWLCLGAILFINLTISTLTVAQSRIWDKTLGGSDDDYLISLEPTSDGGYIAGGYSYSGKSGDKTHRSRGVADYWVIKLKADGSEAWNKTFGGNDFDAVISAKQTPDGGYILAGYSESGISGNKTENFIGAHGFYGDYWLVKLDANGKKVWDKTIGGNDTDILTSLQLTSDGGYLLGGTSGSGISGDKSEANKGKEYTNDYWVVKLDANGNKAWDKTIGGIDNDELSEILPTSDGGYLLAGTSNSSIGSDKSQASKGFRDYWIVKLKADGTKAWDKTIGGNSDEQLTALQPASDGSYIVGGSSQSGISGDKTEASRDGDTYDESFPPIDYWVVKINTNGDKVWDKTIGGNKYDFLSSLRLSTDGGYLLGGSSTSDISGEKTEQNQGYFTDYWVVKLKSDGRFAWDKTIGGNSEDNAVAVLPTQDGNYILGGSSRSGVSGDKSQDIKGKTDYWIVKVKEQTQPETIVWDRCYGGAGTDNFTVAIKTFDGGYLAGGYTNSGVSGDKTQTGQGRNDYWIVKSDKNGQKLWDKRYGGSQDDFLNRVIQTADGGYLLGGSSLSGVSGDKSEDSRGDRDYWVVKVDKQGRKQWDKTLGGNGSDELEKVLQLATGDYVLGGTSNSGANGDKSQENQGGKDYWLVKISRTGTKLWDKRYGGNGQETLGSFTLTPEDGFLLGGTSLSGDNGDKSQPSRGNSDYWLVKTDKDGNLVWDKTYGGSGKDEAYSIARSGNNFFIAGSSSSAANGDKSQASQGGQDYWVVKVDATGTKLWDKRFGGSQHDELRASTFTRDGYYVLAGQSFSGASGDKTQNSQGNSDYWVVQIDTDGNKVVDQRFGGNGDEELRTVFQTNEGSLLLGGRSSSGVSGDRTQPSQGGNDYWLVKLAPAASSLVAAREAMPLEAANPIEKVNLQAYPNPFADRATIRFTLPQTQPATVKVYDSQGREVTTLFQGEVKANQAYEVEWQAGSKAAGMYLLQLQTATLRQQQKLLLSK